MLPTNCACDLRAILRNMDGRRLLVLIQGQGARRLASGESRPPAGKDVLDCACHN
jgi:hypothetical protein